MPWLVDALRYLFPKPYLPSALNLRPLPQDYFLRLAYDGTNYHGYQWQPGGIVTVQSAIEDTLAKIHRRKVGFNGCGRTDAGVHATQYYGQFRLEGDLPQNYLFILNKQLPKGISAHEVFAVHEKAHARFDAYERTYDFYFHGQRNALLERFSSLLSLPDFAPGDSAQIVKKLIGTHDFRAFCKSPDQHNTTVCTVSEIKLFVHESDARYRLRFVANRFLRGMIRILANDIIEVGTGRQAPERLPTSLETGERPAIIKLAPPEGLFLTGVRYAYADLEPELPGSDEACWEGV